MPVNTVDRRRLGREGRTPPAYVYCPHHMDSVVVCEGTVQSTYIVTMRSL